MSTATRSKHRPPISGDAPYEFTADAFFRLVEAGEFPDEARVYLEDGRIYEKMAKTNAHGMFANSFALHLGRRLPAGWFVAMESQIRLDDKNSPLPDLAVIRGSDPKDYVKWNRYPEANDIGLFVEIAVTSLAKDLGRNLERYARNKVPNYWVADVTGRRILAHSEPEVAKGQGKYAKVEIIGPGDPLTLILDNQAAGQFSYEDFLL